MRLLAEETMGVMRRLEWLARRVLFTAVTTLVGLMLIATLDPSFHS